MSSVTQDYKAFAALEDLCAFAFVLVLFIYVCIEKVKLVCNHSVKPKNKCTGRGIKKVRKPPLN